VEYSLEPNVTHWVADSNELTDLCAIARQVGQMGIDLEFNSIKKKICLIQVSLPHGAFLIDSLHPNLDLNPLFQILEDQSVVKIAHSASEDIRLLVANGCNPKGVFDTDIAWRLLNHPNPSLRNMLQEMFQVELSKGQQRSNWSKRPLSEAQLKYAALDVHYLFPLFSETLRNLDAKFTSDCVFQETNYLTIKFLKHGAENQETQVRSRRFETKAKLDELLENVFKPLQSGLMERFGENAGRFLLSNSLANRIAVTGKYSGPDYRIKLYNEVASDEGIDFQDVLIRP
jgi:ribonuclease D